MSSVERPVVGVIGAGEADQRLWDAAHQVGRGIARMRAVLLCGGRGGVMAAAARGAFEEGGITVGLLPGPSHREANPFIVVALPTNIGIARNALIAQASRVLVAVGGGAGTMSEAAMALKLGKPVAALMSSFEVQGMVRVQSADEAIDFIRENLA